MVDWRAHTLELVGQSSSVGGRGDFLLELGHGVAVLDGSLDGTEVGQGGVGGQSSQLGGQGASLGLESIDLGGVVL